jgi:plasmid maintenance system antidote protein VapI
MAHGNPATPHPLIDAVLKRQKIATDAALANAINVAPPVLSKVRKGKLPVGPSLILRLHETFDMPVKEIRALAAA